MRKKKSLFIGIAIGALARPAIIRAYRPFQVRVQTKLYNIALDFVKNFDANNS